MNLAQFRREARKVMKKNPKARRNHHLVVGERVKLSAEGVRSFPSQITQGVTLTKRVKKQLRGTVTSVKDWGYSIKLEGKGPWLKRAVPMKDEWVVSAESTRRKWPGNHYKGVDPMAKKNGRARRNMAMEYDGIKFDTVQELLAYKQATGGSPFQAPKPHKGFPKFAGAIEEFKADFSKGYKKRASTAATREDKMAGKEAMDLLGGKDAVCPGYRPRTKAARLSTNKLKRLGMSRKAQASFVAEAQGMSPKQAMKLAVEKYGLKCAVKNPKLGPSPTIGYPHYYRQPRNAGPYTPRTFPYGYGGRPATYKTAKKNASRGGEAEFLAMLKKGTVTRCPKCGARGYEPCVSPSGKKTKAHAARIQKARKYADHLGIDPFIVAKKNSSSRRWSRYAIQAAHDFPGWAKEGPVEANWTSYPTYAYEQFARANGRLKAVPKHIKRTPRSAAEGVYALGKGPKWPIGDLYHARLALVYAMAPSNWAVHKKVLAAVRREYPQYNWDKWWSQHMKTLRARGRKDRTLASKIEMAAANPAKLSALILKK